ncbi:MAG: 23S rRNA (guanosine(2251)-2'-O)-methyltransferase RlmB [candidate division KSB1 bacterium]|nr:23S rRNA (guanosine(2251)-2'-O)-methyltransferase RlmB [candidate division KSB1 bacterium]
MELLEGRISIEAALQARRRRFEVIFIREGLHAEKLGSLLAAAEQQAIPIKTLSAAELDAMAKGVTHGGVIARCSAKRQPTFEELYQQVKGMSRRPFLLLLEGVDDAQNLGFILRTAEACGVTAVLLKKHLWDFDTGAVSRASSGAYERLPMVMIDEVEKSLPRLQALGLKLYGCIANAQKTINEIDLQQPVILALGGEKRGLSAAVRKQCDRFVKIPMLSPIGSLSLSHAAAIAMGEVLRQRLTPRDVLSPSLDDAANERPAAQD